MTREGAKENIDNRFAGKPSVGIYQMIDKIYDEADSMVCENCEYYKEVNQACWKKSEGTFYWYEGDVKKHYKCHQFTRKEE